MPELAPAPAPGTPVKSPKRKASSRQSKKSGPGAGELILKAVTASKGRQGISYVAVKKYMAAQGYDVKQNSAHIKRAVRKLLAGGALVQLKGSGATGSFKAAKPAEKPKKAVAAKRTAVKAKKPAAKKPAAAKKSAAVAKKPKAAKTTPKKAKKPTAKKTSVKKLTKSPRKKIVRKAASPKKTVKKVVKVKPVKKSPAKRPAKRAAAKKPARK